MKKSTVMKNFHVLGYFHPDAGEDSHEGCFRSGMECNPHVHASRTDWS